MPDEELEALRQLSQMRSDQYLSTTPEKGAVSVYKGRLYIKQKADRSPGPLAGEKELVTKAVRSILAGAASAPADPSMAPSLARVGEHLKTSGLLSDEGVRAVFVQALNKLTPSSKPSVSAPILVGTWENRTTGSKVSMTLQRLPLAAAIDPQINREKVAAANKVLGERNSRLKCREFGELADPIRFNEGKVQEHFDTLSGDQLEAETLLHQEAQILTYDQLRRGIVSCTEQLSSQLGSRDYTVVYMGAKSNQWVTEMALPFMGNLPAHEVVENLPQQQGDRLQDNCLVFFDDGSYSGCQIMEALEEVATNASADRPLDVYFSIPFISSNALNYMRVILMRLNKQNINLHVITTKVPIKTLNEAFQTNPDLIPLVGPNPLLLEENCATLTEWKVPDSTSIPLLIHQTSDGKSLVIGKDRPYTELYLR